MIPNLSNDITFNDLEWPLTLTSSTTFFEDISDDLLYNHWGKDKRPVIDVWIGILYHVHSSPHVVMNATSIKHPNPVQKISRNAPEPELDWTGLNWLEPVQKFFQKCARICILHYLGSPKTARNEQVCAHQMSYRKYIFPIIFGAIMNVRDCSCAPILRFFSAASDGATANRQIPNRIFGQFLPL